MKFSISLNRRVFITYWMFAVIYRPSCSISNLQLPCPRQYAINRYSFMRRNRWKMIPRDISIHTYIFCTFLDIYSIFFYMYMAKTHLNNFIHAYSNILKLLRPKTESFQIKILIFFIFLLRNIDFVYSLELPRRCSSNEYPQSMFLSRNKKIMYTLQTTDLPYKSGV